MSVLTWLAGLMIGAVAAWQVARGYAAADLNRLRVRLEEQVGYWQGEAERAERRAAQLSEQTAAWVAGCQQGREDILSAAHALARRTTGIGDPPEAG
jgi:hypothetical protein